MARYCAYLIAALSLVTLVVPARAQSGTCPDWTTEVQPSPGGSSPSSLLFCSSDSEDVIPIHNDSIPCDDGVLFRSDWPLLPDHKDITIVPPLAQPFPSGQAMIQFALTVDYAIPWTPVQPIPRIVINSYGTNHVLLDQKVTDLFYAVESIESDLVIYYYSDIALSGMSSLNPDGYVDYLTMVQGGYIRIVVDQPPAYQLNRYYLSAVGIADSGASLPTQCSAPSFPPTFTPTPTQAPPTNTPGPTNTPTATPTGDWTPTVTPTDEPTGTAVPTSTPWPTSIGGTITPLPTATPNIPKEITPEPSSTPFPPMKLPTVSFGDVQAPSVPGYSTPEPFDIGLTPNATTEANTIAVGEWISQTEITFNSWLTSTNEAMGWLNPNITSTTGISTPVQIADDMAANITAPVAYVRALGLYVPHLWPYIMAIFLMVLWIFANLLIKFGLALISEALELLRRVIELIPGF